VVSQRRGNPRPAPVLVRHGRCMLIRLFANCRNKKPQHNSFAKTSPVMCWNEGQPGPLVQPT
jgi:hypothetical protein